MVEILRAATVGMVHHHPLWALAAAVMIGYLMKTLETG